MFRYFLYFGVLVIHFGFTFQATDKDLPYYIAAVVQYNPVKYGQSGKEILAENVKEYRKIIEAAAKYNVDLIVFPEHGLTNLPNFEVVENVFKTTNDDEQTYATEDSVKARKYFSTIASIINSHPSVIPCYSVSLNLQSIKDISCAARKHNMYVVINHYERVNCEKDSADCQPDGFLLYNTNIVFARNGSIIARYRKRDLYNEPWADPAEYVQESSFHTDFGVTFDQLIGTDILHYNPATSITARHEVTEIVYPTSQFDDLPFSSSVQNQAAWAYANDVNLLAAGFSSDGGSGIYVGILGPLDKYTSDRSTSLMLTTKVPKRTHLEDFQGKSFHYVVSMFEPERSVLPFISNDWIRNSIREHKTAIEKTPVTFKPENQVETLCFSNFCCLFTVKVEFDVEISRLPNAIFHRYWLVALQASYHLNPDFENKVEMCAVLACPGIEFSECGKVYPDDIGYVYPTSFETLRVSRLVNEDTKGFFNPFTTGENKYLQVNKDFDYIISEHKYETLFEVSIRRNITDLMVFGIIGQRSPKMYDVAEMVKTKPKVIRKPKLKSSSNGHAVLIFFVILVTFLLFVATIFYFITKYESLPIDHLTFHYFNDQRPASEGPPPYSVSLRNNEESQAT